jgi:peptidoglycan/xylan/chitin deacetylase (PgdA/CDA1 family)
VYSSAVLGLSKWLDLVIRYLLPMATVCSLTAAAVLVLPPIFEFAEAPSDETTTSDPDAADRSQIGNLGDPSSRSREPILFVASKPLAASSDAPLPTVQSTLVPTAPPPMPTATPAAPLRPRESAVLPIIMYHYLGPLPPNPDAVRKDLTVLPASFEKQLQYFAEREIETVPLDRLMDHLAGGPELPRRAVALTFDDGYADNYEYAFPLLKKHGMVATFFIVTDLLERPGYMKWAQLQEMADAGMSIQAHSADHADFTKISAAQLKRQLVEPKQKLEQALGRPIRFLAYPAGKYSPAVVAAAKAAGYEAAVTVNHGTLHKANAPFDLLRVRARGTDTVEQLAARFTPPSWKPTR